MTLGVQMYDRKLTVATRVLAVAAKRKEEIPDSPALSGSPDLPPSEAYMITNLYMGYQPTPDVTAALSVDNLFNKRYAPYLNTYAGGTTGSTLLPFLGPGVTVKGELKVRLGGGTMAPERQTPLVALSDVVVVVETGEQSMFIAMNRFRVKKGSEQAFEQVWLNRDSRLTKVPGFVEFHLLKGPEHEDYTLYSSHTVWQSKATFEAWTRSEEFRAAHKDAGQNKPLYLDHPQFEGFEVRQTVRRGAAAVA